MTYVFDNSPLSTLFRNYYRGRFPTLWDKFDELIAGGRIVSTREALREIEEGPLESLRAWSHDHREVFTTPSAEEGAFVTQIYEVPHFRQNIEQQELLRGGKNADPFVIAKAAVIDGSVVTMELFKKNAAKIPNICQHFGITCLTLEEFMEEENWQF